MFMTTVGEWLIGTITGMEIIGVGTAGHGTVGMVQAGDGMLVGDGTIGHGIVGMDQIGVGVGITGTVQIGAGAGTTDTTTIGIMVMAEEEQITTTQWVADIQTEVILILLLLEEEEQVLEQEIQLLELQETILCQDQ